MMQQSIPEQGRATLEFLAGEHPLLIGGEWVAGEGRTIAVENPARETRIAVLRSASLAQVDLAVAAAARFCIGSRNCSRRTQR